MGHDNMIVLAAAALVMIGCMAFYDSSASQERDAVTKRLADIETLVSKMPFDLSCSSDGRLDGGDRRNCAQASGYRIGRTGLSTFVARLDDKGQPMQLVSWGPDLYRQANPGFWRAMAEATGAGR